MILGINNVQQQIIHNILRPFFQDLEFFYYGLRVKGNFDKTSDLDILVKNKNQNNDILDMIEEICDKFDKSDLPFIVNLTNYHKIDKNFYKIIENDLTKIT